MPDAFPGPSHLGVLPSSPNEGSEGSLKMSLPDEAVLSALDTTGNSEGMLEDLDRSEQVKGMLTTSYPHLIKTLKGSYDKISLPALQTEVQELVISLQAAAGMLRVFMLSKNAMSTNSSRTITAESGVAAFDPAQEKYPSLLQESLYELQQEGETCPSFQSENDAESSPLKDKSSEYTPLKPLRQEESPQQVVEDLKARLSEARKEREQLLTQLHQTQGLYAGQVDEKKAILAECEKREEKIEILVQELQVSN